MNYSLLLNTGQSLIERDRAFGHATSIALVAMRPSDFHTTLYPLYEELVERGFSPWFGWASEFEKFPHKHAFKVAVLTDHLAAPAVKARSKIVVGHGLMVSKNYTFTYKKPEKYSTDFFNARSGHMTEGDVDVIVTPSHAASEEYRRRGVSSGLLMELGYLESDWWFLPSTPVNFLNGKPFTLVAPTWNFEFRGDMSYLRKLCESQTVVLKRHPLDPWIFRNLFDMPNLHLADPRISLVTLLREAKAFITDVSSAMFLALHNPEIPVFLHDSPLRENASHWWYDPEGAEHRLRYFGHRFTGEVPVIDDREEEKNRNARYKLRKDIYGETLDGNVARRVADLVEKAL